MVATLLLAGDAGGQTDPPASGDWVVADDTLVNDTAVRLTGNLTVTSTGNLTLRNATVSFDPDFRGVALLLVMPGGGMEVLDGSVVNSSDRFRLPFQWVCEAGSRLRVSHSTVMDCGVALDGREGLVVRTGDALIDNTTFRDCYVGVRVIEASPVVDRCDFRDCYGRAVMVTGGAPAITWCTVTGSLDAGISVEDAGGALLANCTLEDLEGPGIRAANSTLRVEDCVIRNVSVSAAWFDRGCQGLMARCRVDGSDWTGVFMRGGSSVNLLDNKVYNVSDTGIWLEGSDPRVRGNHVHLCQNSSVYMYASAALLEGSLLERSRNGVVVVDSQLFTVQDCDIRLNSQSGVLLLSSSLGATIGWVSGCRVTANGRAGIYVGENATCRLFNGEIWRNGDYGVLCTPMGTMEWAATRNASLRDDTALLRGIIVIDAGGRMVIENATLELGVDRDGIWSSVSVVGGDLVVRDGDGDPGTVGDASELVVSFDPLTQDPTSRVLVSAGGTMQLLNSHVSAVPLDVADGSLDARDSSFDEVQDHAVGGLNANGTILLTGCTFTGGAAGVVVSSTELEVEGCAFSRTGVAIDIALSDLTHVRNTTILFSDVGLRDQGSRSVQLYNVTIRYCGDGVFSNATRIGILLTACKVDRSSRHGIRAMDSYVFVWSSEVSNSASGGVVQDRGRLTVHNSTIHSNNRVGIWANETYVLMTSTAVVGTNGIGVRNSYHPEDVIPTQPMMRNCHLTGATAYDLRLEGDFHAVAEDTYLDRSSVRVYDQVVFFMVRTLDAQVTVRGMEAMPPSPVPYLIRDVTGLIVSNGELVNDTHLPTKKLVEYSMTANETVVNVPYTVTATVAGREWSNTTQLEVGEECRIWVELDLVAAVDRPDTVHEGVEVTLDASGSVAYPFGVADVLWDLDGVAGADATGTVVRWTFPGERTYTIRVTLVDQAGNANVSSFKVRVLDSGPEAHIVSTVPAEVDEDEELHLEGRYTAYVDDVIIVEWDLGDGTRASGLIVTHTWEEAGEYTVTFTVVEADGSEDNETVVVRVVNVAPVAVLRNDTLTAGKRERFDLDGSRSYDTPSDLGTLRYLWDMGGEPFLTGAQAYWRFDEVGEYVINLMVVDDDGAWGRASITVTVVNRPPTIAPVPDALLGAKDPVWSHKLEVADPDDDLENLTLLYPEFEPGGAFSTWVERDADGGWTVYVRPREARDGWRADVNVTVRDPDGGEASTEFRIEIDVSEVDEGGSLTWLIAVAVLVLVVLTLGFHATTRRQVPPPPPGS